MNIRRLQRIAAIQLSSPGSVEMSSWEDPDSGCGTSRCIAGWAIHNEIGAPIWDADDQFTPQFLAFMKAKDPLWPRSRNAFPVELAGELLGLSSQQYGALFYCRNDQGQEFLDLVASGASEVQLADWLARL